MPPIDQDNIEQLTTWARLGTWQHRAVCLDPNERELLVATSIGIHYYALPELELEQLLPCEGEPMALAFRPDGGAFASLERGSQKGRMIVRVHDAADCNVLHRWEVDLPGAHHAIHFGQQGRRLLTSGNSAYVWQLPEDGANTAVMRTHGCGAPAALGREGWLRAFVDDKTVVVWNDETRQLVCRIEPGGDELLTLSFCEHDQCLLIATRTRSVSSDGFAQLSLWDVAKGRVIGRWSVPPIPRQISCTADGGQCAFGGYSTGAMLLDCQEKGASTILPGDSRSPLSIAISPAGQRLAAVFDSDDSLRIWSLPDGKLGASLLPPRFGWYERLSFRDDALWARVVRTRGVDEGKTLAWDLRTAERLPNEVTEATPLGTQVRSPDGRLRAESVLTGQQGPRVLGDREDVHADLRILRCDDGEEVARFKSNADVVSWRFSPSGRHLLVRHGDGTARLWDLIENRAARSFGGWPLPRGVAGPVLGEFPAFSEDGSLLGWSCVDRRGDRHMRVWRTAGEELGRVPTHAECVALHPGNGLVACGDELGNVELWHLASTKLLWSRKAHLCSISCLAFSPDGARLASAASDGSIVVWALEAPPSPLGPPRYHVPAPEESALPRVLSPMQVELPTRPKPQLPIEEPRPEPPKPIVPARPIASPVTKPPAPPAVVTTSSAGCSGGNHRADAVIAAKRVNQPDGAGRTPLFDAVAPWGGCRECVQRLLRAGADPNWRAADGSSVADWMFAGVSAAIEYDDARAIERLLRKAGYRDRIWAFERNERIEVELRNDGLHWTRRETISTGDAESSSTTTEIVQSPWDLRRDGPPMPVPAAIMSTLAEAMKEAKPFASEPLTADVKHLLAWSGRGDTAAALALIKDGVPVDACTGHGYTALHAALAGGHADTALALLAAGASVAGVDELAEPPLALAAANGLEKVVVALLDAGCAVDASGSDGTTPLLCALRSKQPSRDIVEWLLMAGADVNKADARGRTPLMGAPDEGLAQLLLDAGAEVDRVDEYGGSALTHFAEKPELTSVVALLLKAGANPNLTDSYRIRPLHRAAREGAEQNVRLLLAAGAEVEPVDCNGCTPLTCAADCRMSRPAIVQALLDAGADPNHRDRNGFTPLMLAADQSRVEALEPLVRAGAELDARDPRGRTALMRSARGSQLVLRELHRLGADLTLRDANGKSAADLCSERNRLCISTLSSWKKG